MSHMPTFANPDVTAGGRILVDYTATGLEGVSFLCPIGQTLAGANYRVFWAPQGVTNLPVPDFPTNPGDRTTTYFRVNVAAALAAGDKLTFVLFEEA